MKQKQIILLLIVLLGGVAIYYIVKRRKTSTDPGAGSMIDGLINQINSALSTGASIGNAAANVGTGVVPHSGVVPEGATDKQFFQSLGFGETLLDSMNKRDLKDARYYVEKFLRKGVKLSPKTTFYKNIVRIANKYGLFAAPTA